MKKKITILSAFFLFCFLPRPAWADAGTITVTVKNEFGSTIASGGKLEYSCGSGFRSVEDGSADDRSGTAGTIQVIPPEVMNCENGRSLSVRVHGLGAVGYLDWTANGTYSSAEDNPFGAFLPFTLLLWLKNEHGQLVPNITSVNASFTSTQTTTGGTLAPTKDKVGYTIPVGNVAGNITVSGLGSLGYLTTTIEPVVIPALASDSQSVVNGRLPFSVMVLGHNELSGNLLGSGGSARWNGATAIDCVSDGGYRFGCAVPTGGSAGNITLARPGYVDYVIGSVSPPSSETAGQTIAESKNMFTVRVLGIGDWRGESLYLSATGTPPGGPFLATTEILDARRSGETWLVAAVPHGYTVQFTVQVPGYQNTATAISLSSTGQITADFDDDSLTPHWSATFDGPALYPDLKISVKTETGAPAAGSTVRIYSTSSLYDSNTANDQLTSGSADAVKQTDENGLARFALLSGSYWARVTRSGDGQVFEKSLGYIESGGAFNFDFGGAATDGGSGSASFSSERSSISADPLSVPADGASKSAITVTLRDSLGAALSGRKIILNPSRGSTDSFSPAYVYTDSSGQASFTLWSSTYGDSAVGALVSGVSLGKSVTVSFTSGEILTSVSPGMFIKLANDNNPNTWSDTTVYFVAKNGKRYFFPNEKSYFSWYSSYANVRIVTAATMASVPLGGPVHYRPGQRLLKVISAPEVYAVSRGGILRPIVRETVAKAISGDSWSATVDDLPDAFFAHYIVGNTVLGSGQYSPTTELANSPTIDRDLGLE